VNSRSSLDFDFTLQLTGIIVGAFSLIFIPFILYFVYQYFNLFSDPHGYTIFETVLDSPSTSFLYKGSIYFQISFVTTDGRRITKDTKPMWSDLPIHKFSLSDYNNKKIKMAYSIEKDKLIVIG